MLNKNFIKKLFFLCFFIIIPSVNYCSGEIIYKPKNIPKTVKNYIEIVSERNTHQKIKVFYIMKWHNFKVYHISFPVKGVSLGGLPMYILFDGKTVRNPTREENRVLQLDAIRYINHKKYLNCLKLSKQLKKNTNKTMTIVDKTAPPEIPPAIKRYADKYMHKTKDRRIFYLMDWNSQHVYRTYWLRYGLLPVKESIILYDEKIIRRPTDEEFKEMRSPMSDALLEYAMEQAHQDNKD